MPQAIIEGRVQKRAYAYLLEQYKIKHPDFTALEIKATAQEIQSLVGKDELLHFIAAELNKKSNFDNEYLYQLVDSLLVPEVLAKFYPNCSFNPFSYERDMPELYTLIDAFISSNTQEVDRRMQNDDDRFLRRLDSLARILSLNISNSACVAVALHEGQLFVSSNVGGRVSAEEITQTLIKKIAVLKELVDACSETEYEGIYHFCQRLENTDRIFALLGSGVSVSVMQQSLAKVIHVLKTNEYTFCAEFQHAFKPDQPVIVITPVKKDESTLSMRVVSYLQQVEVTRSMDLPNSNDKHIRQKDAHAEQMLHVFVSQTCQPLDATRPTRVGLSKLCCGVCHEVFNNDPYFMVRGTHNNVYLGTLNVRTGTRAPQNSTYFGTCNPIESGLFSPSKNTLFIEGMHGAADPIDATFDEYPEQEEAALTCCDAIEECFIFEDYDPIAAPALNNAQRYAFFNRKIEAEPVKDQEVDERYETDPMELSDFVFF